MTVLRFEKLLTSNFCRPSLLSAVTAKGCRPPRARMSSTAGMTTRKRKKKEMTTTTMGLCTTGLSWTREVRTSACCCVNVRVVNKARRVKTLGARKCVSDTQTPVSVYLNVIHPRCVGKNSMGNYYCYLACAVVLPFLFHRSDVPC